MITTLAARDRVLHCPCGGSSTVTYDQRIRRWRHLDLGCNRWFLQAPIRRLLCPDCGRVRTEVVAWARPGARHTRAFEDVVAWLTQRADLTTVASRMRCAWKTVSAIAGRVIGDHLSEDRLNGLRRIGVDEISYRRGHRYLTVVVDHDTRRVVWVAKDRRKASLMEFYDALGEDRCAQLEAVSMDMSTAYRSATRQAAPNAAICLDPFHVMQWAGRALDSVFAATNGGRNGMRLRGLDKVGFMALIRTGGDKLTPKQHAIIRTLQHDRYTLFRAWELKELLRDLYRIDPAQAPDYFDAWLHLAATSGIPQFITLAAQLANHRDGILAAVQLGQSNSRGEGLNAHIRLLHRRGYGYHSATAMTALIYLCCSHLPIAVPTQR